MKQTPLFAEHKSLGAKMAPFGGWQMPISYTSVLKEHEAVRGKCGIFDVSHMGEIFVEGPKAEDFLQSVLINDVALLEQGQGQYTAMCNHNGGLIDDLIIYRLGNQRYLVCANAANIEKDFQWLNQNVGGLDVKVSDHSANYSQVAVQGPNSEDALRPLIELGQAEKFSALKYMEISTFNLKLGNQALIARTGYTGEKGYEVYLENEYAINLWRALLEDSDQQGIQPVGLAARDTLRLEACYILYGNDVDETVTPLEAGIGWATKLHKGDFVGRSALLLEKDQGVKRRLVSFIMDDKSIPRADMAIYKDELPIGKVTSGSVLPTVGGAGGLALIDTQFADVGTKLDIDVRGKRRLATIVKKPIYAAKVKS